jgi:hypothetical protein
MDNWARQRRLEDSGKIIGVRKADEDRHEHDERHARKEQVIETASGQVRSARGNEGAISKKSSHSHVAILSSCLKSMKYETAT